MKQKKLNQDKKEQTKMLEFLRQMGCRLVGPWGQTILPFTPSCTSFDAVKQTPKQHLESKKGSVD
jgi:hypothetical protein